MTTVSDFGTLEIKQLRVQNDIAAVRYGTEIMDRDLIFKVGDISNPNQSIRFSVHDGDTYKDAFAVDSNGFAVSDLNMSGPSTGITGIDELVKLGEMRVQHFNDHNNERAGEIVFSVNIGDTDVKTVDILSLSPEEVEITTASKVHGVLSCGGLVTNTVGISGNEFRTVVASFSHPLGSSTVSVERDETGAVVLDGKVRSDEATVQNLTAQTLHGESVVSASCSVGALHVGPWTVCRAGADLAIKGGGRLLSNDLVAPSVDSELIRGDELLCDSLSASHLRADRGTLSVLSAAKLHFESVECGEHLSLPNVASLTVGSTTMDLVEGRLRVGSYAVFSDEDLVCAGLKCKNGDVSAVRLETTDIFADEISAAHVATDSIEADKLSVGNATSDVAAADRVVCRVLSVAGLVGVGSTLDVSNDEHSMRFDDRGLEVSVLRSETVNSAVVATGALVVSAHMSCASCASEDWSARSAAVDVLVVGEACGDACSVGVIDTCRLNLDEATLRSVDGEVGVSRGLVAPSVSTQSLRLNELTFEGEDATRASVSIKADRIVVQSDLACTGETTGRSASYGGLSCATIQCEAFFGTEPTFHAGSSFSVNTGAGADSLVFEDAGLRVSGPSPSLTLSDDDDGSELTLRSGLLQSSGVLRVSCAGLIIPGTLSAGALTVESIGGPDDSVAVTRGLTVGSNVSVATTLIAAAVTSSRLSSQSLYATEAVFDSAHGVREVSGPGGRDVRLELDEEELVLTASSVTVASDSFALRSSPSSHVSVVNRHGRTTISSSGAVAFQNTISAPEIATDVATLRSIVAPSDLQILSRTTHAADVRIKESCVIEHSLSCASVATGGVRGLTFLQSEVVRFTEDGVEDHMVVSKESVVVGDRADTTDARLAVQAIPFRDGICVTSDDRSTVRLQTKEDRRRGMVLTNERDAREWVVGVGGYPLEGANTCGMYFDDDPFLQLDPGRARIQLTKKTSAPDLSVSAMNVGACSFHVDADARMALSCAALVVPGVLSASHAAFVVTSPASLVSDTNMNSNKIYNLGTPSDEGDAVNIAYLDERLEELFQEERVFTAPVYWAPPDDQGLRSFGIGLSYTNLSSASDADLAFELLVGTSPGHSLRLVSDLAGGEGARALVEVFASGHVGVDCPIELRGPVTLPAAVETLAIQGGVQSDRVGVGVAPAFPLHVVSSSDDDCALLQSSSSRARVTVESSGEGADQAMFSCRVDSTVFSTGYSKSSDAFVVASSTDLVQNTHLVISRSTNQVQSAGDVRVVKSDGSFSIEELGATVFLANKNTLKCQNFDISFDDFSVDHRLGNLSLFNLSSFGARITGSAAVSAALRVSNTNFAENDVGDMTVDRKMVVPDIETDTLSLDNRQGFNLYQDDTDVLRFRGDGSGLLLDFDATSEALDFSFPTLPNVTGRGALFVSDAPIMSLKKQCVNIDASTEHAKLNVSAENGPQLSIINPSNAPVHADFSVDDSGELHVTSTQRRYSFDGDLSSDNLIARDFIYFGAGREWRMGVSDDGSFVFQNNAATGAYVTKAEIASN